MNSFLSRANSRVVSGGSPKDKAAVWETAYSAFLARENAHEAEATVDFMADFLYSAMKDTDDFFRAYGRDKKTALADAKRFSKAKRATKKTVNKG